MLNIATTRIRRLYNISRFMTISRMMTNIFSFVYMYYACVYAVYSIILYIIIYIYILFVFLFQMAMFLFIPEFFEVLIATSSFMTNTRPTRQHMPSSACQASKKSCVSFGCNAFCASGITWKFTSKQLRSSCC